MTLVITVDEAMGLAFGGKRQSRDRELTRDIWRMADGRRIVAAEYSRLLFEEAQIDVSGMLFAPDPALAAEATDVVLLELGAAEAELLAADELVIYCWNRRYPATVKLDPELIERHFVKADEREFVGNSHEKLTRVTYKRK